jgi:tetratricopeptide (TPR) repeat protein
MIKIRFVFLLAVLFLWACTPSGKNDNYDRYLRAYTNAKNMGDVNAAIGACHLILADDSTRTNFYDSLVQLYINTSLDGSGFLAARQSLKYRPDNDTITGIAARLAEKLGMADTAIVFYRRTYLLNKDLENLYNIAQLQYNTGKDHEAEQTVDLVLKDPGCDAMHVYISSENTEIQKVPMRAACLNIKAMLFMVMGSKEVALRYLDDALKIAPDFRIAKKNKEDILSGSNKPK